MSFFMSLWHYLVSAAPYLMLGLLLSGLIHQYINAKTIKDLLGGKSLFNIAKAALIGVPLPLCSCSVIPTTVTLRKAGASTGSASAFMISTPESGVDSISVTYALMDLPMTIIRPIAAFISAFVGGFFNQAFNDFDYVEVTEEKKSSCCHKSDSAKQENKFLTSLKYGFVDLLKDISIWLTFGLILGACISHFVPDDTFYKISETQSKLLILLIGIPFYICASATTPIAASLVLKGMSPGTALLLLLVGPATNASNIMVLQKYIGKKGIIINILAVAGVALLFSYATDYLYQMMAWSGEMKVSQGGHEQHLFFMEVLTVVFCLLLINALIFEIKGRMEGHSG